MFIVLFWQQDHNVTSSFQPLAFEIWVKIAKEYLLVWLSTCIFIEVNVSNYSSSSLSSLSSSGLEH